jgi:hypothetical protein
MAILSHFSSLMIVATFLWSNIFFQDLAFQVTILFWFTLYQIDIFFLSLLLSRFSSFLLGRTLFFFFVWLVSFASPYLVQELINFHQDSIVFFFLSFSWCRISIFLLDFVILHLHFVLLFFGCHLVIHMILRFLLIIIACPREASMAIFVCLLGWLLESLPSIWFRVTKKPRCTDLVRNSQAIDG